jgi:hypothetical protein
MSINSNETKIIGEWIVENGKVVADAAALRIEELVKNGLVELGSAEGGWYVLYFDKSDGRYWEKSYPNSHQHGGGAPSLINLSLDEAVKKYKLK